MTFTAQWAAPAIAALALALPASAQAGSIAVADGVLAIDAETSFLDLDVQQDGSDFQVFDYSGDVSPGAGCTAAPADPLSLVTGSDGDQYTCSGDIGSVRVRGGADGDFAYVFVSTPVAMSGGAGPDNLYATGATARLEGGDGDDDLHSDKGADELLGGAGDDILSSDPSYYGGDSGEAAPTGSADRLDGGPGRDLLVPGPGADTVAGGDGRDTLSLDLGAPVTYALDAVSAIEAVTTGEKDDTLTGDDRFNELRTYDGNDTVDGGGGSDVIDTGKGDDTVFARDGVPDDVSCGEGSDRVTADPDDFVDGDCEAVDRASLAAPVASPSAPPAPALQLRARRRHGRLVISGRVVPAAGSPAAACIGGGVTVSVARVGRRVRRIGTVLRGDCTFVVRLKASRRAARRARVSARFAGTPGLPAATAAPVRAARRSR